MPLVNNILKAASIRLFTASFILLYLLAILFGSQMNGVIPRSLKVEPWGWIPDLLAFHDLTNVRDELQLKLVSLICS